jgi:Protein of unknown function (DUF3617)
MPAVQTKILRPGLLALGLAASPLVFAQADIRPGQWELSVEFSVPESTGFKLPPIVNRQCLTAADARDPGALMARTANPAATGCVFSDKKQSAGYFEFSVKCEGTLGFVGHGAIDYTPTTMQGTLNLGFDGGTSKRSDSITRFTARRVGDCGAG